MQENQLSDETHELMNEPGSVGEEQLPQDAGKSDKHEWTYSADKNYEDFTWWQRIQRFFRGAT